MNKSIHPPRPVLAFALMMSGTVAFAQLGVVVSAEGRKAASAALIAASASTAIKNCALEARGELLADIEARIKKADAALTALAQRAKSALPAEAGKDFQAALNHAKAQERTLRICLDGAKETAATAWPECRAELSARYSAYTEAVAQVETVFAENT